MMPLDPQHGPRRAVESFCPLQRATPRRNSGRGPVTGVRGKSPPGKNSQLQGFGGNPPPTGYGAAPRYLPPEKNSPSRLKGKVCDTAPMPRKTRAGLTEHDAPSSPLHPQHGPRRTVESFCPLQKAIPRRNSGRGPVMGGRGKSPPEKKTLNYGGSGGIIPPDGARGRAPISSLRKNSPYPSPRLLRGRGLRWRGWRRTGVWDGRGGRGRHWS